MPPDNSKRMSKTPPSKTCIAYYRQHYDLNESEFAHTILQELSKHGKILQIFPVVHKVMTNDERKRIERSLIVGKVAHQNWYKDGRNFLNKHLGLFVFDEAASKWNDILDAGGFKWNEKREIVLVFRNKADVKRGLDTLNALKFEGEQIRCKLDNREGTRRMLNLPKPRWRFHMM